MMQLKHSLCRMSSFRGYIYIAGLCLGERTCSITHKTHFYNTLSSRSNICVEHIPSIIKQLRSCSVFTPMFTCKQRSSCGFVLVISGTESNRW